MRTLIAVLSVAAVCGPTRAGGLESGPQVGDRLPGPFEPLHLNGPDAGEEACLYCRYGNDPVVMVFARSQSDGLARLVRAAETAGAAHKAAGLAACVVYLDTSEPLKAAATRLADREKLRYVTLACVKPSAVADYRIAAGADVTVLLYSKRTVRANHAFRVGELTDAGVRTVIADLPKILPAE